MFANEIAFESSSAFSKLLTYFKLLTEPHLVQKLFLDFVEPNEKPQEHLMRLYL